MYYGNIMISEAKAPRNWWSLPFSFGTFYFNYILKSRHFIPRVDHVGTSTPMSS